MSEELKKAYRLVIDDLDAAMEVSPNATIANASNLLEERLQEMEVSS